MQPNLFDHTNVEDPFLKKIFGSAVSQNHCSCQILFLYPFFWQASPNPSSCPAALVRAPVCTKLHRRQMSGLLHPCSSVVCSVTPTGLHVVSAQFCLQPEHFLVLFSWSQQDLQSREVVIFYWSAWWSWLLRLVPFIMSAVLWAKGAFLPPSCIRWSKKMHLHRHMCTHIRM